MLESDKLWFSDQLIWLSQLVCLNELYKKWRITLTREGKKFVHALFRHTCTLIACRNGEEKKQDVLQDVKLKQIFTLTKTVTILFVHERGNSVHASRGYAARSVPEFPRSWTNNIVTITWRTSVNDFRVNQGTLGNLNIKPIRWLVYLLKLVTDTFRELH